MAKVEIGMNLEATRHHDKPFEWGLDRAAEMGYEYVEPMVHFGRELMSEAGYYHTYSLFDDPRKMRRMCEDRGLKISGLQVHGPLGRPDRYGISDRHPAAEPKAFPVGLRTGAQRLSRPGAYRRSGPPPFSA